MILSLNKVDKNTVLVPVDLQLVQRGTTRVNDTVKLDKVFVELSRSVLRFDNKLKINLLFYFTFKAIPTNQKLCVIKNITYSLLSNRALTRTRTD